MCGAHHIVYLIEQTNIEAAYQFGMPAIHSIMCGTQVISDFFLKVTLDNFQTCDYLALMTRMLTRKFEVKIGI